MYIQSRQDAITVSCHTPFSYLAARHNVAAASGHVHALLRIILAGHFGALALYTPTHRHTDTISLPYPHTDTSTLPYVHSHTHTIIHLNYIKIH